jgi:hypothetical protein
VHVRTMRKRLRRSLSAVAEWCQEHRHAPVDEQQKTLTAKLRGLFCKHLFVAMSNAIFDGYAVRMESPRRIRFLLYSRTILYPEVRKQLLLGTAGTSPS